jgi:hypothetical protein
VLYDVQVGTRLSALRAGGAAQTGASMNASRSRRFDDTRPGSRPAPHTRVPQVALRRSGQRIHFNQQSPSTQTTTLLTVIVSLFFKQKIPKKKHNFSVAMFWKIVLRSTNQYYLRAPSCDDGLPQWPAIAAAPHVHTHLMQARRSSLLLSI